MEAIIISIGSELLMGNVVDTNSRYLSMELSELGFDIYRKYVIGDNKERIKDLIENVSHETSYIFITGGLGSTEDDNTKEAIIELFGNSEINPHAYSNVKNHFSNSFSDKELDKALESNVKVFTFPKGSKVFENLHGTAYGFKCKINKSYLYVMPGPPKEMKAMFEGVIKEDVVNNISNNKLKSRFYKVAFLGEWQVNERLKKIYIPYNISLNTFISDDGCSIRLTIKENEENVDELLDKVEKDIFNEFGNFIYSKDKSSREEILIRLLTDKKMSLSTAESITGGLIASSLIGIDGASNVIEESFITYSDNAKSKLLGVNSETLSNYSAVSEEVCEEMLLGLYEKTKADVCVTTTGYAGPSGDVGNVYIGIKVFDYMKLINKRFKGSRNKIRNDIKNYSIDKIRQIILNCGMEE